MRVPRVKLGEMRFEGHTAVGVGWSPVQVRSRTALGCFGRPRLKWKDLSVLDISTSSFLFHKDKKLS